MCLGFRLYPEKPILQNFISQVSSVTTSNKPSLGLGKTLRKSRERRWQSRMSSLGGQRRRHFQKRWQALHLSLSKVKPCCCLQGSQSWTLGCQGFPRAQTPSLTCLGFPKTTQTHRTLISAGTRDTASNIKHGGEKLLRHKPTISEALWQGEDRYWFCFMLFAGTSCDSLLRFSGFTDQFVFLLLLLSHFFYLLPILSSFVFLCDPHRRSLSTDLAGRIWDCQRAFAVSLYIPSCPFSF